MHFYVERIYGTGSRLLAAVSVFRIRIHLIRIRIQHFRRNTEKIKYFLIKNCNFLIPRPP
jgi:hypothetical protein